MGLASLASIIHTVLIVYIWMTIGRLPLYDTAEGLNVLSLLFVVSGLIHYLYRPSEVLIILYLVPAFLLLSIFTFSDVEYASHLPVEALMNELLFIHILLIFIAYVSLFISSLHGIIYLIQRANLKQKRFKRTFFSLFSMDIAQRVQLRTVLVGMVFMGVSLWLGIQWGLRLYDARILLDFKVLGNLIIVFLYLMNVLYLYSFRSVKGFSIVNIVLFILSMINYIIASQFSEFHTWNS